MLKPCKSVLSGSYWTRRKPASSSPKRSSPSHPAKKQSRPPRPPTKQYPDAAAAARVREPVGLQTRANRLPDPVGQVELRVTATSTLAAPESWVCFPAAATGREAKRSQIF